MKIICDPHQSIYEFRGGVTDELFKFEHTFKNEERKRLSGNFRSTPHICKAISPLRPLSIGAQPDDALGTHKDLDYPVHVLSYPQAVSPSIGVKYSDLVRAHGEDIAACPVLASTRVSGAKAIGEPSRGGKHNTTLRLAEAVMNFHFAPRFDQMKAAIEVVHRILLELQGSLATCSYHQYLQKHEI